MISKEYQIFADMINQHLAIWKSGKHATYGGAIAFDSQSHGGQIALRDMAICLAHELSKANPRFDRKRFLDACGII